MQRWIWAILAAGAIVSVNSAAGADDAFAPNYDGRLLRRHQEQLRKARADELRCERARLRARLRYAGKTPPPALDRHLSARQDDIRR
jgi:hypothetical protein